VLRDGFSMVYTFFDPEQEARSLGHHVILDHIRHAQDLGLPHVYLGYWVKGSPKMAYKRRYKPLEVLDGDRWRPLRDDE
jgi:arginine-tRNA-protein transferase